MVAAAALVILQAAAQDFDGTARVACISARYEVCIRGVRLETREHAHLVAAVNEREEQQRNEQRSHQILTCLIRIFLTSNFKRIGYTRGLGVRSDWECVRMIRYDSRGDDSRGEIRSVDPGGEDAKLSDTSKYE